MRAMGKPEQKERETEMPEHCEHIWRAFAEVYRPDERPSYTEIEAYQRATGHSLQPWEVDVIRQMATAAMRSANSG